MHNQPTMSSAMINAEHISSFSNPRVKYLRGLRSKKERRREKSFLAEGMRLITEAQLNGYRPQILIFALSQNYSQRLINLSKEVLSYGGQVLSTTPEILSKISGKDNAQAVIASFQEFSTSLDNIDRMTAPLWFVAQSLRDPGNLGTILRTGDAVGGGGLILIDESADPFSIEAVRASMGAIFTQKIAIARWAAFLSWLRKGDGFLLGTSLNTAIEYHTAKVKRPTFILLGNESRGLPSAYEEACDLLVKIPMHGKADSLNVASAAAVMAYQLLDK